MKVSFFTPTYNRANLIQDLYNSLVQQDIFDFEWIIVDDGSNDGTREMVENWVKECKKFPINYVYKKNGGKHTAINIGVDVAKGDYFCIVDSDDYLTKDACSLIINGFEKLPENYAGIGFNKVFEDFSLVGKTFQGEFVDATSLEREKYKICGDKAEVFFTGVLRKYKFPVFEDEKFVTETVVWYRIADDGLPIRWFNQSFYVCRYQPSGLSMSNSCLKSLKGYTLSIKELLKYKTSFSTKFKSLGVYVFLLHRNGFTYMSIATKVDYSYFWVVFSGISYALMNFIKRKNSRYKQFKVKDE